MNALIPFHGTLAGSRSDYLKTLTNAKREAIKALTAMRMPFGYSAIRLTTNSETKRTKPMTYRAIIGTATVDQKININAVKIVTAKNEST